jgi:hypothetical protein
LLVLYGTGAGLILLPQKRRFAAMKKVYRLAVYEIVNFDEIDTLDQAEYELVEVIEGSTPEECVQKAAAAYDMDRFGWSYAD